MRFAAAILISLAATSVSAQTPERPAIAVSPDTPLVNIAAEGRSERAPDLATFNAGVVAQGKTAGEAMSANTARMNAVLGAVRSAGVNPRDIQTASLSLQPQYHYPQPAPPPSSVDGASAELAQPQPPRIIGYEARNTVSVRLRRVSEMGKLIDALVAAGANQVDGPYFSVDQPDAAADEARADALRKATARAQLYARQAGFRTARLLTISEGGGYYPVTRDIVVTAQSLGAVPAPPPSTMVQPGQVAVGVNISAQFVLERCDREPAPRTEISAGAKADPLPLRVKLKPKYVRRATPEIVRQLHCSPCLQIEGDGFRAKRGELAAVEPVEHVQFAADRGAPQHRHPSADLDQCSRGRLASIVDLVADVGPAPSARDIASGEVAAGRHQLMRRVVE